MKALLVDAFDSFSHIIYQYLRVLDIDTEVKRSGELTPKQVLEHKADFVVLGPGPGTPEASGHVAIVSELAGRKPVLGVCLGHQSIAVAFGASVEPAKHQMHGKTSMIEHDGLGVFGHAKEPFKATRYHSLVVVEESLPAALKVTARSTDDGYVMGLRHAEYLLEGVQFHPESILTAQGLDLFSSFSKSVQTM